MSDLHDNANKWLAADDARYDHAKAHGNVRAIVSGLLAENERLAGFVSKLHARPVGPDRCPFTGREFWGNITHPELGEVATYGGPFDTYTLPARTDDDEEYFVRRFDHDRGHWLLDDMEFIGLKLVDDQLYTSEDDPAELRTRAEAAEAENERLAARIQHTQQWYAERWHWMQQWFRTTGKDLPIADQFWSIIANGTPDVNTAPSYQQILNAALHRAEAAEARLKALCEAEPWAYGAEIDGKVWVTTSIHGRLPDARALIPRPSMESGK